ncbi:Receptor-interacting serine/threonine-protein kinase 3 [Tulasnella sp. 424]|nr:Receptor-interacting serine/threonine-protein kinase 3 [Tulasnella sp. 424]
MVRNILGNTRRSFLITEERDRDTNSKFSWFSESPSTLAIAKLIQVWKDLNHPNVLGLLGYTLTNENEIDQLISPYLINPNIREFLNQAPVGVAQRLGFILTDKRPFDDSEGDLQVFNSLIQRKAPGQPDMLLSLIPDAPKPEYASTLRLLHSYLPLCWEYEPKKRPPISLLRCQVFMFSFEDDAGGSVVATLEELAHLLIPPERLRIIEHSELGEGSYGEVVLGTLDEASSSPRDVAVKRLKAVGTRGERVRLAKRLARELKIWAKIKHPNVVELIGYYLDEKYESPLLISTLMTNGNVLDYIERYKPDIERRIAFVKGITAGLACLHNFDPAICHADLKPASPILSVDRPIELRFSQANVLIDLHMNAVLCDFGLASFVSGSGDLPGLITTTSLKGTPRYMSPELLMECDYTQNLESDVLTGRIPYAELTGDLQFYLAMDRKELPGDIALLLPSDAETVDSESALTLRCLSLTLPRCWDFAPHNRPVCALLSNISNLSPQTENEAGVNEDVIAGDTKAQQGLSDISSQRETSSHGNEYVASGGLEEGTKLAERSTDPPESGSYAEVESAQGDKRNVPTETHSKGDVADEGSSRAGQDASAIKRDAAHSEAQLEEDDQTVHPFTSNRASLKISIQTLCMLIGAAALILSLSANIFFLLRRVDPLPHHEASRPSHHERDL